MGAHELDVTGPTQHPPHVEFSALPNHESHAPWVACVPKQAATRPSSCASVHAPRYGPTGAVQTGVKLETSPGVHVPAPPSGDLDMAPSFAGPEPWASMSTVPES